MMNMLCFFCRFLRKRRILYFFLLVTAALSFYISDYQMDRFSSYVSVHQWMRTVNSSWFDSLGDSSVSGVSPRELVKRRCSLSSRNQLNMVQPIGMLKYVGFLVRAHSLFYCSVPKVATRTLLKYITYLHVHDDLLAHLDPNFTWTLPQNNLAFSSRSLSNSFNRKLLTAILFRSVKNDLWPRNSSDSSVALLHLFLSRLIEPNQTNSSELDLWALYQKQIFPLIRLENHILRDPLFYSSNFTRVIFVRHPLERLASAYVDKIATISNNPLSVYTHIRRATCQKFSSAYLTEAEQSIAKMFIKFPKRLVDPCEKIVPKFEHFLDYIISGQSINDVHWRPYSNLCQVCRVQYNFIGKYENMEEDLRRFRALPGLPSTDFNTKNLYSTGKSKDYYRSMYSSLPSRVICFLKRFYSDDFQLFDYQIEDYLPRNRTILCPPSSHRTSNKRRLI